MQSYIKYIVTLALSVVLSAGFSQDDMQYVYRKERLFTPFISTNGYGISYLFLQKQTVRRYGFQKIGFSELKHAKEIKGVNPRYSSEQQFIYGKLYHAYPIEYSLGRLRKIVLKSSQRSIGIRYYYSGGVNLALLKPAYYEIEVVYSQDSSTTVIDKFDPEYHDINNIVRRVTWFKGLDELQLSPGVHFELGFMADFSRRHNRIHGVGISSYANVWVLPIQIIANGAGDYLHFGFRLYYIWGKFLEDSKGNTNSQQHVGWGMLKKY